MPSDLDPLITMGHWFQQPILPLGIPTGSKEQISQPMLSQTALFSSANQSKFDPNHLP